MKANAFIFSIIPQNVPGVRCVRFSNKNELFWRIRMSVIPVSERKTRQNVGIVIHNKANLFANGITQNAYFIYQCLEACGFKCQFLCHDADPEKFGFRDLSVKTLSTDSTIFNPNEYHTVITVTRPLYADQYAMLKANKIRVISFICGNSMLQHIEDFVRGESLPGASVGMGLKAHADEMWIIPSLQYSIDYFSLIRGIPTVRVVPHLWSKIFISETCVKYDKKPETDMIYNYSKHVGKKITLLIMEPNVSVCKNAWMPIIICEKLNSLYPELIDQIFVFNFPEKTKFSFSMIEHLKVRPKIRIFKRLAMSQILLHFNNSETMPILLTHQILTGLNYLYYEALSYGWPLVHNSTELEDCGYFYPEHHLQKGVDAILNAFHNHNYQFTHYCEKAQRFLKRSDPEDEENKKIWTQLVNAGIAYET